MISECADQKLNDNQTFGRPAGTLDAALGTALDVGDVDEVHVGIDSRNPCVRVAKSSRSDHPSPAKPVRLTPPSL
ncbi:MAG TPA: hypothetical protein VGH98_04530 [Gemmatimonadaceae bacterium]